jgi:hypothetical protein
MTGLMRLRVLGLAVLLVLCVACAVPAAPLAKTAPTYRHETVQAYESQLKKGEIASAAFNRRARNLHLVLRNGERVLYNYPAGDVPKLEAALKAKKVPVSVLRKQHVKKAAKHTRRYIAIGVAAVIVIAGLVFVLSRRRRARD